MNVGSARMSPEIPTSHNIPHGGSPASSSSSSTNAEPAGFREKVREIPIKVMRGAASTLNNGAAAAAAAAPREPTSSFQEGPPRGSPRESPSTSSSEFSQARAPSQTAPTPKPQPQQYPPPQQRTAPDTITTTQTPTPQPEAPLPHDPSIPIPLPPTYNESSAPATESMEEDEAPAGPTAAETAPADDAPPKKTPITAMEVIEDVREKTREYGVEVEALGPEGCIAKIDKRYLYMEEMLMRQLIRLDNVETEGKDEIRTARKLAVKEIQGQISMLEKKGGASK